MNCLPNRNEQSTAFQYFDRYAATNDHIVQVEVSTIRFAGKASVQHSNFLDCSRLEEASILLLPDEIQDSLLSSIHTCKHPSIQFKANKAKAILYTCLPCLYRQCYESDPYVRVYLDLITQILGNMEWIALTAIF